MNSSPSIGFLLHDVARLLRKRFEQRSRAIGLTRSQWQVLFYISKNEGIHQSALADLLEIEPITLVRILDKMEARNLIERRRHETDRRLWLLYLKPEAHPLLDLMHESGQATRDEAFARLSEEELEQLKTTLSLIKSNLLEACERPVDEQEASHG